MCVLNHIEMFYIKEHICDRFYLGFSECIEPTWPTNGVALTSGLHYNATVQYRCFSGYRMIGPSFGWCYANGSWSIAAPSCILGEKNFLFYLAMLACVVIRLMSYLTIKDLLLAKFI